MLIRSPDGGAPLLLLEVTIRLNKGKRKRPAPKTISLYENQECSAICPIIHFLALAFADNAFHLALIEKGLNLGNLHSFRCAEGRNFISFRFRDEILDLLSFRTFERRLDGIYVHPYKVLSAKSVNDDAKRLGQCVGLPHPFRVYCLRREVNTELIGKL